ncbi:hypothetical protein GCM10027182_24770 [Aquaspirillum soli]
MLLNVVLWVHLHPLRPTCQQQVIQGFHQPITLPKRLHQPLQVQGQHLVQQLNFMTQMEQRF